MKNVVSPKINFESYYRLEDLSNSELELFKEIIVNFVKDITEYTNIYVVGSYCFNLKEKIVNDLDIVVIVPETFRKIIYPCPNGTGYDLINKMAVKSFPYLKNTFNKKTQIFPVNEDSNNRYNLPFRGLDGNMVLRPYFDLLNLEWKNKKPYDYFPYAHIKGKWIKRQLIHNKHL